MDHTDFDKVDKYLCGVKEAKYEFIHNSINLENNDIHKNNLFGELS